MRTPLPAAAIACLLLVPVADAASADLELRGPSGAVESGSVAPLQVTLRMSDFMCQEPRQMVVLLTVAGDGAASGSLVNSALLFEVPAGSYFLQGYEATQTANVSVSGAGALEVVATFQADEGACIAPGGFPAARANATLAVVSPGASAPPAPAPDDAATNETNATLAPGLDNATAEETASENETAADEDTTTPTTVAPTCAPQTSCGYIGEYDPARPEESTSDVPSPGLLAAGAAVGLAALLLRRKR